MTYLIIGIVFIVIACFVWSLCATADKSDKDNNNK